MQRNRATAIAAQQENGALLFIHSLRNFSKFALDFMYGTPERSRFTLAFALITLALGMAMMPDAAQSLAVCPV